MSRKLDDLFESLEEIHQEKLAKDPTLAEKVSLDGSIPVSSNQKPLPQTSSSSMHVSTLPLSVQTTINSKDNAYNLESLDENKKFTSKAQKKKNNKPNHQAITLKTKSKLKDTLNIYNDDDLGEVAEWMNATSKVKKEKAQAGSDPEDDDDDDDDEKYDLDEKKKIEENDEFDFETNPVSKQSPPDNEDFIEFDCDAEPSTSSPTNLIESKAHENQIKDIDHSNNYKPTQKDKDASKEIIKLKQIDADFQDEKKIAEAKTLQDRIQEKASGHYHVAREMNKRQGILKNNLAEKIKSIPAPVEQPPVELSSPDKPIQNLSSVDNKSITFNTGNQKPFHDMEASTLPHGVQMVAEKKNFEIKVENNGIIFEETKSPLKIAYKPPVSNDEKNVTETNSNHIASSEEKDTRSIITKVDYKQGGNITNYNLDFIKAWDIVKKLPLTKEKAIVKKENKKLIPNLLTSCFGSKLEPRLLSERDQIIALSKCIPPHDNTQLNSFLYVFYTKLTRKPISMILGQEWKEIGFLTENPLQEIGEFGVGMVAPLQMLALLHFHFQPLLKIYRKSLKKNDEFNLAQVFLQSSRISLTTMLSTKLNQEINQRSSVIAVLNQVYFSVVFTCFTTHLQKSKEGVDCKTIMDQLESYANINPLQMLGTYKKNLEYLEKINDQEMQSLNNVA